MDIAIIGVPFNGDGTPVAVENPAAALRQAGLVSLLENCGHSVIDSGDLALPVADGHRDDDSGILNLTAWRLASERLARTIGDHRLDKKRFLLLLDILCQKLPSFPQLNIPQI